MEIEFGNDAQSAVFLPSLSILESPLLALDVLLDIKFPKCHQSHPTQGEINVPCPSKLQLVFMPRKWAWWLEYRKAWRSS